MYARTHARYSVNINATIEYIRIYTHIYIYTDARIHIHLYVEYVISHIQRVRTCVYWNSNAGCNATSYQTENDLKCETQVRIRRELNVLST